MINIIKTGSKGNAVIYHDFILIDCGVSFKLLEPYAQDIGLVLLTHEHGDHFKKSTLDKLISINPFLIIAGGDFMLEHFKKMHILKPSVIYDFGKVKISPVVLKHDVPNFGYRIFYEKTKVFHATDTADLEGIEAPNYDLYAIEQNYDEDYIFNIIAEKEKKGEYVYEYGKINCHLSEQQALDFFFKNKGEKSKLVPLHY